MLPILPRFIWGIGGGHPAAITGSLCSSPSWQAGGSFVVSAVGEELICWGEVAIGVSSVCVRGRSGGSNFCSEQVS